MAAVAVVAAIIRPTSHAFTVTTSNGGRPSSSLYMSTTEMKHTVKKQNPIVVSAEAEALSHSDTTMKLTPSYELFQVLAEEEGGKVPDTTSGNALRDASVLKEGSSDTLEGLTLSDYITGSKKIETLPDPFKMVEKELQPFSDSIKELVSTDQPILSMAAKHFFEKRHGKRFRPTIVQLMAKAVAAATPEKVNGSRRMEHDGPKRKE